MALQDSWRLRLAVLSVATIGSLAIAVVGAEAAVRIRERRRTSVPGTMPTLFYPHERLRQALVRRGRYYDWARTNAQGFRGADDLAPKRADVRRVFAVGESTTFDAFVSHDSLAWPAQLERTLAAAHGCEVDVSNVGVPGYRMLDNSIRLQTQLGELEPDVILLYEPNNDLFATIRARAVVGDPDPQRPGEAWYSTRPTRWLLRHSELFAKLYARAGVERGRTAARQSTFSAPELAAGARRYQREMDDFIALARRRGIEVLVLQAVTVSGVPGAMHHDSASEETWRRSFPGLSAPEVFGAYAAFDSAARGAAQAAGAPFIDLADGALQGDSLYAPGDPIHFNDAGARRMATALASSAEVRKRLCGT